MEGGRQGDKEERRKEKVKISKGGKREKKWKRTKAEEEKEIRRK